MCGSQLAATESTVTSHQKGLSAKQDRHVAPTLKYLSFQVLGINDARCVRNETLFAVYQFQLRGNYLSKLDNIRMYLVIIRM